MFLETLHAHVPLVRRCQTAASQASRSRHHHHGSMNRASQVLAQGVPKSYRDLAENHGNVSTLYSIIVLADDPRGKRRSKTKNTHDYNRIH